MVAHLLSLHPQTISLILSYLLKSEEYDEDSSDDSDSVEPEDESGVDRRPLARVARTCRQLWHPAVSILWRELPNFAPILFTLSRDLFTLEWLQEREASLAGPSGDLYRLIPARFATRVEVEPTETGVLLDRYVMRLLRDPTIQDFVRCTLYAQYIQDIGSGTRTLGASQVAQVSCPPDVWTLLIRYGPMPLFPNVCRLTLHGPETEYLSPNTLLFPFGESLRHLHLYATPPQTGFFGILHRLASQLEELTITEKPGSDPHETYAGINLSLAACLPALSCLRMLRIEGVHISTAALSTIGSLPFLENLSIEVSSLTCTIYQFSSMIPGMFPLIRDLSVIVDDLRWVTAFLDYISSSCLDSIRLLCRGHTIPPHVFDDLFSTIASRQWRLVLERITINTSHEQPPCDLSRAICLLLPLPALAVILMLGWFSIIIDDRTLDAMASAWPRLVNLNLACSPEASRPEYLQVRPKATFAGLIPLAYRCRYLQSINLAINTAARLPAPASEFPPRPVLPTESQVMMLHVGWTGPPRDPMRVAVLLSEIFPRLLTVQYFEMDDEDLRTTNGWGTLLYLLYRFKLVRFQERRWVYGDRLYSVPPDRDWGF